MRVDGIKFLRIFNLVIFAILFGTGLYILYGPIEKMETYLQFANTAVRILVPLIVAAAGGSPVKKLLDNQRKKIENGH